MHSYIIEECSFVSSFSGKSKEKHPLLFVPLINPHILIDKHPILWLLYIIKEWFNPQFMRAFTFVVSNALCAEEVELQQKLWNLWNKQRNDGVVSTQSKTKKDFFKKRECHPQPTVDLWETQCTNSIKCFGKSQKEKHLMMLSTSKRVLLRLCCFQCQYCWFCYFHTLDTYWNLSSIRKWRGGNSLVFVGDCLPTCC